MPMADDRESDPDFALWYDPETVLRQEANRIHGGKKRSPDACDDPPPRKPPGARQADGSTNPESVAAAAGDAAGAAKPKSEVWEDISPDLKNDDLRIALYDRHSVALCLSGGGIRSASFNVGVIEALAVHPRPDSTDKTGDAQA